MTACVFAWEDRAASPRCSCAKRWSATPAAGSTSAAPIRRTTPHSGTASHNCRGCTCGTEVITDDVPHGGAPCITSQRRVVSISRRDRRDAQRLLVEVRTPERLLGCNREPQGLRRRLRTSLLPHASSSMPAGRPASTPSRPGGRRRSAPRTVVGPSTPSLAARGERVQRCALWPPTSRLHGRRGPRLACAAMQITIIRNTRWLACAAVGAALLEVAVDGKPVTNVVTPGTGAPCSPGSEDSTLYYLDRNHRVLIVQPMDRKWLSARPGTTRRLDRNVQGLTSCCPAATGYDTGP